MSSALSKQARRILNGALKAADPAEALLRHVSISGETLIAGGQRYSLKTFRNIYVIGAGKAVGAMALAIQRLLGERISGGFLNVKSSSTPGLRLLVLMECGHPLPDAIGDDLDVIGSGPTVPDRSTFADARAILAKYGIQNKVPQEVRARLSANSPETPKPGDKIFKRVQNLIVGSNRLAVDAAAAEARALGYHTMVLSTFMEGETRDVARVH